MSVGCAVPFSFLREDELDPIGLQHGRTKVEDRCDSGVIGSWTTRMQEQRLRGAHITQHCTEVAEVLTVNLGISWCCVEGAELRAPDHGAKAFRIRSLT